MTLRAPAIAALSALLVIAGATPSGAEEANPEVSTRALEHGAMVLKPFKMQLKSALQAGLAESPDAAIEVCQLRAPRIAAESSSSSTRVGRTSHKLRNPANAPAAWMKPLLAGYLADPDLRDPRVVPLEGGGTGYVEPIFVQSMCLACHGEELAEPVRAQLVELYPEDQATGFRVDDLRGLFWVEFRDAP
jgi:hypothetical protein